MTMKILTVLLLCALTLQIVEMRKNKEFHGECMEELNLTKEDFKKRGDNLKCFSKCVLEKSGLMADGALVEDKVKEDCKSVDGSDPCEIANNYRKCAKGRKG